MNVMWSSRLFRVSLFLENASILMIWGCFSIVSNVIRSNYCCRRHTMHGNMVFSRESIFPTPQQSGCLCVCIVQAWRTCTFPSQPFPIMAKLGIKSFTHTPRCFGSFFDVNCLVYLVSSGFLSFKPTSS